MIKSTNEIALITAVSDLKIFLDSEKGFTVLFPRIKSRSVGEKSPSGPIKIHKDLLFIKSSVFKLALEFTSANKSLVDSSKLFTKSFSLTTSEISGGINWLDCSVASTTIFLLYYYLIL